MVPFVVVPDVVEFNAAANTAVELVIVAAAAVTVMFSEENADAEVDEIDEGRTTEWGEWEAKWWEENEAEVEEDEEEMFHISIFVWN